MQLLNEMDLTPHLHEQITTLRNQCFPDHQATRSYYKQLPHCRLMHFKNNELIAHMGIDHRMININGEAASIFGVIDFCVHENYRSQGIASRMLQWLTELAEQKGIDYLFLIADKPDLYLANHFHPLDNQCTWLRLHEYKSYGVTTEKITDIMLKPIAQKPLPNGPVDLLGYMF